MTHLKKYLLLIVSFLSLHGYAQDKVFQPSGSLSVDVGIPAQGKNIAFGRVMNGLFNGGINYQYNVFGGLTLGVGVKHSFFVINSFALNNAEWGGGLHAPSVYGKVGYERFISERFSFSTSIRTGYTMMISYNDSCQANLGGPYTEGAFFMEPQVELLLLTDKNSSDGFSLVLGYNFIFTDFGPRYLAIDHIPHLVTSDYVGITRFLSIGFGYRYYMGRK
ncbi:MAG: hypothetical protein R2780_09405 [Crocinitomicaceae bacterium]